MCGICGSYDFSRGEPADAELLERMNATLVHRGPDGGGVHIDGPAGLAARRLAIIDLAHGDQPMLADDGAVCVVQNGEIFNHLELRAELERAGVRFRTECDTEVLLHLYLRDGPAFVERLRGMFAFALWDRRERRLLLARDRFGIKPLYYRCRRQAQLRLGAQGASAPALVLRARWIATRCTRSWPSIRSRRR